MLVVRHGDEAALPQDEGEEMSGLVDRRDKRLRRTKHNMARARAGLWLISNGNTPEPPESWTDLERKMWAQVARPEPPAWKVEFDKQARGERIRCRLCGGKIKANSLLDVCSRHAQRDAAS